MLKKIGLCFLLCAGLWAGGLGWFISQVPTSPAPDDVQTDAIVVLTGGAGRLEYGLKLLAEGKGKALFISGVGAGGNINTFKQNASAAIRDALSRLSGSPITLGRQAENTIGNAEETARWVEAHRYKSIRLVTSHYHMPRSLSEFSQEMPGITLVPDAVFHENFPLTGWWMQTESRKLMLSEYHKFLAGKLRHWLVSNTEKS